MKGIRGTQFSLKTHCNVVYETYNYDTWTKDFSPNTSCDFIMQYWKKRAVNYAKGTNKRILEFEIIFEYQRKH